MINFPFAFFLSFFSRLTIISIFLSNWGTIDLCLKIMNEKKQKFKAKMFKTWKCFLMFLSPK
jgi:hypothetical protein